MILTRCRVNISNAAVLGLKEDLDIVNGTKYNTALTIFFVPYVIFEIPSNILLKKLKPHVWCMFPSPLSSPLSFTLCVTVIDLTSVPVYVRIRPGHDFPGSSSELGRVNDHSVVPRYVQSLSQVPVISTRMLT